MKRFFDNMQVIGISKRPNVFLISLSMLIIGIFFINTAQAIPAFARKHQTECSSCHSAWPALNAAGRAFKENGYRLSRDETLGFMDWDQTLPVTAMIKARPYEKKDSGEKKLRALHEVELMVAGAMANNFSGWFELEAEDDAGVDAQADIGNIRLMGAVLQTTDDNSTATAEVDNNATYVEARYTFTENGRPTFVPLVRRDSYEKNDGQDNYDELTLQLGYYFAENARGFIEYWDISGPTSADDDNLVTLQVEVGF